MELKVLKSIPLHECQTRAAILAEKYGSLSLLHEEFSKGRMPPGMFDDYINWTNMEHALRAYQEGEDFEYLAEEKIELDNSQYKKLTPKRLELLDYLGSKPAHSINELAESMGRDVKNVYNDLKLLDELGFIGLNREGRRLVPDLLVYEITITLG